VQSRTSRRALPKRFSVLLLLLLGASTPAVATAQDQWTGVGAIAGTAMFMDTTSIVRSGTIRKVWIRSIDAKPRSLVVGHDTLSFDTVIGLNVFDCARNTRTVTAVRYMYGDDLVFDVPETHDRAAALRPHSFFDAIYRDLCGLGR
jgi:hypothetical protein